MATNINSVTMVGRLVKDPELTATPGSTVTRFTIANNRDYKSGNEKKSEVSFFDCEAWGRLGEEVIHKYAKKGVRVGVTGRLKQDSWEHEGKKYSRIKVVVDQFEFLEGKASEDKSAFNSDDIPF